MVGDFGGGGMLLAFGVVCGLLEAQRSGTGQVIDAAMVDGSAALMTMFWTLHHSGLHDVSRRGVNMLDTGAHFYDVYECADGEYVSIGSIEPQFYAELLRLTGLDGRRAVRQAARPCGVARRSRRASPSCSASKTRAEWCAVMEHTDVCFAPVLRTRRGAAASAQRRPGDVRRRLRRAAAGAGAALQPHRARAVAAARPRRPAHSRGARSTGASTPSGSTTCIAGRRRQAGVMGTLVVFHAHPDDEAIATGGSMARAHAEGHRVVLVVATDGEHGEVPDDLADGETLADRRRAETERSAAALGVDRLVWLGYADSGMTGWEANLDEESFWKADVDEAAGRLPTSCARSGPTC